MAYCTKSDILEQLSEDELIELTDDDSAGTVNDTAVTRAIADADAEIDSYCAARYSVPFLPVPVMIRKCSVDISIYNLYSRRGDAAPDERKERYDRAIRFLRDVATDKATLGGDAPSPDSDGGPEATTSKSDRIFTTGRTSDSPTGSLDNY